MKKGRKMCGNRDASEKQKPWVSQPKAKDMGVFVCLLPPKVTNPHYRKILHTLFTQILLLRGLLVGSRVSNASSSSRTSRRMNHGTFISGLSFSQPLKIPRKASEELFSSVRTLGNGHDLICLLCTLSFSSVGLGLGLMHLQLGELVVDRGGEPLDYLLLLSYAPAPLGTCSCERKTTSMYPREKKAWAFCLCLAWHTRAKQAACRGVYLPTMLGGRYTLECGSFVGQLSVHRDTFKRGIPCKCRQAGGGTKPLGRPYLIGKKSKSLDRKK